MLIQEKIQKKKQKSSLIFSFSGFQYFNKFKTKAKTKILVVTLSQEHI